MGINLQTESKRRPVSNEELVATLANADVRGMVETETNRYRAELDEDQRSSVGYYAVWRALQYHRPEYGQKFTTSLWSFLRFELNRELRKTRRQNGYGTVSRIGADISELELTAGEEEAVTPDPRLPEVLETMARFLPKKVAGAMRKSFLEGCGIQEIADSYGWTREATNKAIRWGLSRVRELCDDSSAGKFCA